MWHTSYLRLRQIKFNDMNFYPVTKNSSLSLEKSQSVFSNDNIKRMQKKPGLSPAVQSPTMSKMPTAESIAGAVTNTKDIASRTPAGHWFFGIQAQCHAHSLLMAILDCVRDMGYVRRMGERRCMDRNGDLRRRSIR